MITSMEISTVNVRLGRCESVTSSENKKTEKPSRPSRVPTSQPQKLILETPSLLLLPYNTHALSLNVRYAPHIAIPQALSRESSSLAKANSPFEWI